MVQDFWNLDQLTMTTDQIIEKAKLYYAEDFIEDYDKWKDNLKEVNSGAYNAIKHLVPKENFIELSFDELCTSLITKIETSIKKHGFFERADIITVIDAVYDEVIEKSLKEWNVKKHQLSSMMQAIKKVVAVPIKNAIK